VSPRPHPRIARHAPASRHGTLSRFRLLAEAVEAHRSASGARGGILSRDQALYERLAELEQSLPIRSDAA
jgi:hypothetical protein